MALTDKLTAIGDAIRSKMETTELIPLAEMPNKVNEVFEIGSSTGYSEGYLTGNSEGQQEGWNNGYEAGRKAEYDQFWDAFQKNGERTNYETSFRGYDWGANNFFPKYNIRMVGGNKQAFYNWNDREENFGFDLKQRLEDCGIVLDTSKATNLYGLFAYGRFCALPTIDLSSCSNSNRDACWGLFAHNYEPLHTIEKIIIPENLIPYEWFSYDRGLQNLTIEGTIGQDGFNVSYCPLTHDSLMSIINALKTFTDGTTKTVTLGATNIAKLTDAEKAVATQKGWTLA